MQIKVFLEKQNKEKNVSINENSTIRELMKILEINASEVIVVRNNEIITEKEKIKPKDTIKFLSVISGG
ncbi:MAG: MoaD/ThiS family protein [Nanoarchaeota archaeon]|nr:MoaD/ThiS family protein [Nanoarchaeota archaeon]